MTNPAALPIDDVLRCISLLESVVADRTLLVALPEETRIALLTAAGRVAGPDLDSRARLSKAVRRSRREAKQAEDRATRAATAIRALRQEAVFTAPPRLSAGEDKKGPERLLNKPRCCYVCKTEYRRLHFFYDALCEDCAQSNYEKRFQTARLDGKVALITGARLKIGYQAALMLLRSGAQVIATTRFPHDAAQRYAREADFNEWGHRLQVHGLDLRHAPSVERFAEQVSADYSRLDVLINNAAQTVRRPPGFYAHLLETECRAVEQFDAPVRHLLGGHTRLLSSLGTLHPTLEGGWRSPDAALGIHSSAALSQRPYALEPEGETRLLFPVGRLDADLQQVDLRRVNTWRLTLSEVPTAEMLEVHLVNAVAPFVLCGKLKQLMLRDRADPGHIVNVSAMEGSFSRGTKTDKHPHTNMAKAALNMMTLTSASDYAQSGIYMNAVDTGWVTDEDPAVHAERKQTELDFQPPLDIVDGAARVCDPVFHSINTREWVWGKFFKDYRVTAW